MSVPESFIVGFICLFIVFLVLAVLYALINGLSAVLVRKPAGQEKQAGNTVVSQAGLESGGETIVQASSGELKLLNVDEKTAAMIMAIVSDEAQIPLSELVFKSIKAID